MRSHFPRRVIKDIATTLLASHIKKDTTDAEIDQLCIAIGSLAKLFVGDVIESSVEVMKDESESIGTATATATATGTGTGTHVNRTVRPKHIEEGIRRLTKSGCYPLVSSCSDFSGIPLLNVNSTRSMEDGSCFEFLADDYVTADIEECVSVTLGQDVGDGGKEEIPLHSFTGRATDMLDFYLNPSSVVDDDDDVDDDGQ